MRHLSTFLVAGIATTVFALNTAAQSNYLSGIDLPTYFTAAVNTGSVLLPLDPNDGAVEWREFTLADWAAGQIGDSQFFQDPIGRRGCMGAMGSEVAGVCSKVL